jgi:hypothetical protein
MSLCWRHMQPKKGGGRYSRTWVPCGGVPARLTPVFVRHPVLVIQYRHLTIEIAWHAPRFPPHTSSGHAVQTRVARLSASQGPTWCCSFIALQLGKHWAAGRELDTSNVTRPQTSLTSEAPMQSMPAANRPTVPPLRAGLVRAWVYLCLRQQAQQAPAPHVPARRNRRRQRPPSSCCAEPQKFLDFFVNVTPAPVATH